MEGEYCAIYYDDSSCHGYYIIKFSSSPYTLQLDLSIDVQVISFGEMVCEVTFKNILLLCFTKTKSL